MSNTPVVSAVSVASQRGITQRAAFEAIINKQLVELSKIAASHINPVRFLAQCVAAASRNPLLFQCDAKTIVSSMLMAAELGLGVGVEQEAALVPFKNNKRGGIYECQLLVQYQGLLKLVWQSELVAAIDFAIVYEGDHFEYKKGTDLVLEHRPNMDRELPERFWPAGENDEPGPDRYSMIRCVYACATTTGGGKVAIVLTRTQINRHRNQSRAKDSNFWVGHYEAMAIKTALRQLCKYLPKSTQLAKASAIADAFDTGEAVGAIFDIPDINAVTEDDAEEQTPTGGMAGAKASLKEKAAKTTPEGEALARLTGEIGLTSPEISDFQAWAKDRGVDWIERAKSASTKEMLYAEDAKLI